MNLPPLSRNSPKTLVMRHLTLVMQHPLVLSFSPIKSTKFQLSGVYYSVADNAIYHA